MKRNWKQKNEIKIRKNISVLMDELNAFEQRMDERLTDEMGKISFIEQRGKSDFTYIKGFSGIR